MKNFSRFFKSTNYCLNAPEQLFLHLKCLINPKTPRRAMPSSPPTVWPSTVEDFDNPVLYIKFCFTITLLLDLS